MINTAAKNNNWMVYSQTYEDAGFGPLDDIEFNATANALVKAYQIKGNDLTFDEIKENINDAKDVAVQVDLVNKNLSIVNLNTVNVGDVIPAPISEDDTVKISWVKAYYGTYITVSNGIATLSSTPVATPYQEALFLNVEKNKAYVQLMKSVTY